MLSPYVKTPSLCPAVTKTPSEGESSSVIKRATFAGKGRGSVGDGFRSPGEAFRQQGRKEEWAVDMDDAARFVGRAINGPVGHGLRRGLDGAEGCHGIFEGIKRVDEAVTLFSQKAAGTRSAPADEEQVSRQPQRDVPVTDAGRVNADEPRVMKRRARRIQFGKKRQCIKRRFAYSSGQGTEVRLDVPIAWLAWYLTMPSIGSAVMACRSCGLGIQGGDAFLSSLTDAAFGNDPVMSLFGVTSNAQFRAGVSSGQI